MANAVAIRRNAVAVQRVLASTTNNAVTRTGAVAGAAERRTRRTGSAVTEAAIGTDSPCRGSRLLGDALRPVIGVLCEAGLTGDTVACAVGALRASELAS